MTSYGRPDFRQSRLSLVGRITAALAAGGVFAALSWDSSSPSDETSQQLVTQHQSKTAERQSIVTEDNAPPQLEAKGSALHEDDSWGLDQSRSRPQPWPVDGLRTHPPTGNESADDFYASQSDQVSAATNVVPHSRSPP